MASSHHRSLSNLFVFDGFIRFGGSGCTVCGLGVQGLAFRVCGLPFRVKG